MQDLSSFQISDFNHFLEHVGICALNSGDLA